mmetsp:Transcript_67965/g.219991  ORF Transcript_67965/g.219991 Transcript_67965/m.219991 type:complete len:229 (-) Transcript_67965:997-1683(-)
MALGLDPEFRSMHNSAAILASAIQLLDIGIPLGLVQAQGAGVEPAVHIHLEGQRAGFNAATAPPQECLGGLRTSVTGALFGKEVSQQAVEGGGRRGRKPLLLLDQEGPEVLDPTASARHAELCRQLHAEGVQRALHDRVGDPRARLEIPSNGDVELADERHGRWKLQSEHHVDRRQLPPCLVRRSAARRRRRCLGPRRAPSGGLARHRDVWTRCRRGVPRNWRLARVV